MIHNLKNMEGVQSIKICSQGRTSLLQTIFSCLVRIYNQMIHNLKNMEGDQSIKICSHAHCTAFDKIALVDL